LRRELTKTFTVLGAVNGFLAVALGAFGAHALRDRLSVGMMEVYKTGVQYHMLHAVALLVLAVLADRSQDNRLLKASGWLFVAGMVLFCGSLYALATTGVRVIGAVTPLGGLCFLAGWALLAGAAVKS